MYGAGDSKYISTFALHTHFLNAPYHHLFTRVGVESKFYVVFRITYTMGVSFEVKYRRMPSLLNH